MEYKTAEEILANSFMSFDNPNYKQSIIECMHEFHNQFQTPASGGSEQEINTMIYSIIDKQEVTGFVPSGSVYAKYKVVEMMQEFYNSIQSYLRIGDWISASKRLPDVPDEFYLIAVRNKNKDGGIWLIDIAVFDSDGQWQKSNVWEDVLFWKPLPAPPGQSSPPQPNAISVIEEELNYHMNRGAKSKAQENVQYGIINTLNKILTKLKKQT